MDPEKLKVVDLRKELQQRGLDTKGNKAVLVKRLRDALEEESGTDAPQAMEQDPLDNKGGEPEQVEEVPVKEEPKSIKKEPPKVSPKKEVVPQTPRKIIEEEPKPQEKIVKVEPVSGSPGKTEVSAAESEQNGEQKVEENEKDEQEIEKMETETRGEKRKREDDDVEETQTKEKRRREDSPVTSPTKSPEKKETPVKKEKPPPKEDEPEIDYEKSQLSWFDSDLHLKIDNKTFLSAKPNNEGCFGYVWAGARATHGISSGKICFEVKITEELKWDDPAEKMHEKSDKVVKYRYKIDRRKEKGETKSDDKKAEDQSNTEGENDKEPSEEQSALDSEKGEKPEEKIEDEETNIGEQESKEIVEETETDAAQDTETEENKDSENAEIEENKEKEAPKPQLPPIPTHYFRVGFSLLGTTLQLGETKYSYAYESTGKFVTDKEFEDYGVSFGAGDVVGAYLSIDNDNVSITYTVNGDVQPTAITVPRSEFPEENFSLFPHVLCRNYAYEINFGAQEEPWFPHPEELKDYQFLQTVEDKIAGPRRPEKREECEVLLMIGLPGSGKTYWVKNHLATTTDKYYTVIGNHPLFDRMTVEGQPMKSRFGGSWKILVDRIQKCLNQLTDQASLRRRNYIIDQTNVFPNAQRRKLRAFDGFKRKAVIVVCEDDEHARRQKDQQNDYGKSVPESTMFDLKAQMELPQKCEWIEELIFPDLNEEEAKKKVKEYNEEANKKGYFKRWQSRPNDRRTQSRNFRGGRRGPGFGGGRYDRFSHGSGWSRPGWGDRRDMRGPLPPRRGSNGGSWRSSVRGPQKHQDQIRSRDNRNTSGYGSGRNQGAGRNISVWQTSGGGYNNWGSGNTHGGWNAAMYGSQGYGAWNQAQGQQSAWKYGSNQSGYGSGQSQRSYGGNQASYGNNQGGGYGNNQAGYNAQTSYGTNQGGYNSASQGNYGSQAGYGQQNWNYYGQYNQQQGWSNQGQSKAKSGENSASYNQQDWAQYARQYAQQQWPQAKRQ